MTKTPIETVDSTWNNIYRAGAIAALLAALVFRRNFGSEITLFAGITEPTTIDGWFTLLQGNSLLGLIFLGLFDLVDYALVGVMFFALYVVFRRTDKKLVAIATVFDFAGIAVYFASNLAFPMLFLSSQYATATSETQRAALLAQGQTVLDSGFNQSFTYQNAVIYLSLLLLAVAGLIMSAVMLRRRFGKITAYVGILAAALDLAFIVGAVIVPAQDFFWLSASLVSFAGLLLLVWHLLIGLKLYKIGTKTAQKGGAST